MLGINIDDVLALLASLRPQLIALGIILIVAIVITAAVNKRTVHRVATRKLIRSQTWIVALIASVVAISLMVFGPLSNLLNLASGKGALSDTTIASAQDLAVDIESEAITLLKNDQSELPLTDTTALNVFGWASTNPVYGGTGSGSMSDAYPVTSLIDGLHDSGFDTNAELSDFYTTYRSDRPVVGMWSQDWTLPEPPASTYSQSLIDSAKNFSDTAVVIIGRVGGEGADLPTHMGDVTSTSNSTDYVEFDDGDHILQLDRSETDMINLVTSNFDDVIVVYNGANAFQLEPLTTIPQVKSILWVPPAGQTGFDALGKVLRGQVNPSGKTADTWARDLTTSAAWNNTGSFTYDNMDDFTYTSTGKNAGTTSPTFVNYTEGIYVGYRWYETAAAEGVLDYDSQVLYPFGHGLSYSTFAQTMSDPIHDGDTISVDVTVTNTGAAAGRDTVEVYDTPPYTEGGIEKSAVNLVSFGKTEILQPGQSQVVSLSFAESDLASYDDQDAQAWVLDGGDYALSIRSDSHTVIDQKTLSIPTTIVYGPDNTRPGDQTTATNRFDYMRGTATYLSRAGHFANRQEALAAPTDFTLPDDQKSAFMTNETYDPTAHDDESDVMPTTNASNGVRLADLYGLSYDDPQWDALLDELSVKDMDSLIARAGYGTGALGKIGKVAQYDLDGPAALNNNFTGVGSIGFPANTAVAATWNPDLAERFGEAIGTMGQEIDATGWYAPSMNIHRSPFAGRNFEYFSEDPLLSGTLASQQVAGAKSKGMNSFIKHFALNDQETNRLSFLATWSDEQALREIYFKPFEMSVKDGGASGVMSSFVYFGPAWAGATSPLMHDVLRDEWGFNGMVLTDYFGGYGYMNADQAIRNGNDAMLATVDITNHVTDKSATSVIAMRQASKNILYQAVNTWKYADGEPEVVRPAWQWIAFGVTGLFALIAVGLEVVTVRRFRARKVQSVASASGADTQNQEGEHLR